MSGTSADGIDVALCRIAPRRGDPAQASSPRIQFLGHLGVAYPRAVRAAVLRAMDASDAALSVADLSRLNWRLGALYADAVERAARQYDLHVDLVACHGQTLYHQSVAAPFAGARVRATWQIGEASVLAERLRVPVVSDLRPADLAAGGQGAPLVPMLDYALFRHARRSRILLNLGGIANVTAIPAACTLNQLQAFDTGPANMVIDAAMAALFERSFDRAGRTAARGSVVGPVLSRFLSDRYFHAAPPKSCGREQFGSAFTARFIAACESAGASKADIIATATALTAASVERAIATSVLPHLAQHAPGAPVELIAAGGGVQNRTLLAMLETRLRPLGIRVETTATLGIPAQAKEAVAFALLGWLTWHRLPGNVPAATGASRPVVLGKVTCV